MERNDRPGAPWVYGGAMATAITRMKYEDRPDLSRVLGALLAAHAKADVDVVAPVPLHRSRLVERGFNQASLLARPVAAALEVRFEPTLLARVRSTPRQASLDRVDRRANVVGAFVARADAANRRVLLIDDVRTTGATLDACAAALGVAGARSVETLVLAEAL